MVEPVGSRSADPRPGRHSKLPNMFSAAAHNQRGQRVNKDPQGKSSDKGERANTKLTKSLYSQEKAKVEVISINKTTKNIPTWVTIAQMPFQSVSIIHLWSPLKKTQFIRSQHCNELSLLFFSKFCVSSALL